MHLQDYNDHDMDDAADVLAKFEAADGAALAKIIKGLKDTNEETAAASFNNFVEPWEVLKRESDDMTAWLRNKYNGMVLHDDEDDELNRRIFTVTWQKQRRPRCYVVRTGIVKKNGNVNQSADAVEEYSIDDQLHSMILPELNTKLSFKKT